jgi:hypothetical protein
MICGTVDCHKSTISSHITTTYHHDIITTYPRVSLRHIFTYHHISIISIHFHLFSRYFSLVMKSAEVHRAWNRGRQESWQSSPGDINTYHIRCTYNICIYIYKYTAYINEYVYVYVYVHECMYVMYVRDVM